MAGRLRAGYFSLAGASLADLVAHSNLMLFAATCSASHFAFFWSKNLATHGSPRHWGVWAFWARLSSWTGSSLTLW
eukprot:2184783-Pyramimonas_sp.AAC.1